MIACNNVVEEAEEVIVNFSNLKEIFVIFSSLIY